MKSGVNNLKSKDNYKIIIRDKHWTDGDESESEMSVFGSFEFKDDKYKISYMEHEGDLAGCVTDITFTKDPKSVYMTRTGAFTTNLLLQQNRRNTCQYNTPYGTMMMGIFTYDIDSAMNEDGGDLAFTYSLDVEGGTVSKTELHFNVIVVPRRLPLAHGS